MEERTNKVNLRRNESWKKTFTLALSRFTCHALGEKQETRADGQMGILCRQQINFKTDCVIQQAESNHSAKNDEIVSLANGQERAIFCRGKRLVDQLFVIADDEQKMANL